MLRGVGLVRALVLVVVVLSIIGAGQARATPGDVEERIAAFWKRVDAMQPGDYLSSSDLGQWALNVIERDARARITVADFRASTAGMQAALDRAGRASALPTVAPTPIPTRAPVPTLPPTPVPTPGAGVVTLTMLDGRGTLIAGDGTYLGVVSSNRYASDSICNQYGTYGSPYATKSVRNKYSSYGSPYATYSAYNAYASTPPRIWYEGAPLGYLTKNQFLANALDPDYLFAVYGCVY